MFIDETCWQITVCICRHLGGRTVCVVSQVHNIVHCLTMQPAHAELEQTAEMSARVSKQEGANN